MTWSSNYLSKRFENRKKKMLKDLPYTLDLITVSVEAGLSFDGALARVVSNVSGELSDEFGKCLKEIRMGIERKTALSNMSERCDLKAPVKMLFPLVFFILPSIFIIILGPAVINMVKIFGG